MKISEISKKILAGVGVAAIGAATTFSANIGSRSGSSLSDFALANIEALATGENGDEPDCSDGIPRISCKIWNIVYISFGGQGDYVCNTGGEWKCALEAK